MKFFRVSLLPLLLAVICAGPAERTYGEPKVAVRLSDETINESSGVARSSLFAGKYYTHNDSGDTARFWRFDLTGKVEGPFHVRGAGAIDWEDMASAKLGGKNYLYFADIGDNSEKRASVQIYRVEEPDTKKGEIRNVDKWDLTYPDGSHNAEAFMVHPSTGEMMIVTKAATGVSLVFVLSGTAAPGKGRLTKLGEVKFDLGLPGAQLVTGGDISPDAKHVVLRTYFAAKEFDAPVRFDNWFKSRPRPVPLALERQGEAIGYSLDGKCFITTSEHEPCQISAVPIRD